MTELDDIIARTGAAMGRTCEALDRADRKQKWANCMIVVFIVLTLASVWFSW